MVDIQADDVKLSTTQTSINDSIDDLYTGVALPVHTGTLVPGTSHPRSSTLYSVLVHTHVGHLSYSVF